MDNFDDLDLEFEYTDAMDHTVDRQVVTDCYDCRHHSGGWCRVQDCACDIFSCDFVTFGDYCDE